MFILLLLMMKKIKVFFIMIVTLFAINITKFAFAAECDCTQSYPKGSQCWNDCLDQEDPSEPDWWDEWNGWDEWDEWNWWDEWDEWNWWCDESKVYRITNTLTWCCPGAVVGWECQNQLTDLWINMNTTCLLNWQCSLNVYKVMWIRKSNENPTVLWFFQDIVLAATTFVWTVVVIALIVSGLIFAFGSITWKDTKKAKTIMIDCLVWLLLVMWSYTIIRLIQFIATAWS